MSLTREQREAMGKAAHLLDCYAEAIRNVPAAELENHAYLPEVEDTAYALHTALSQEPEQPAAEGGLRVDDRDTEKGVEMLRATGGIVMGNWQDAQGQHYKAPAGNYKPGQFSESGSRLVSYAHKFRSGSSPHTAAADPLAADARDAARLDWLSKNANTLEVRFSSKSKMELRWFVTIEGCVNMGVGLNPREAIDAAMQSQADAREGAE